MERVLASRITPILEDRDFFRFTPQKDDLHHGYRLLSSLLITLSRGLYQVLPPGPGGPGANIGRVATPWSRAIFSESSYPLPGNTHTHLLQQFTMTSYSSGCHVGKVCTSFSNLGPLQMNELCNKNCFCSSKHQQQNYLVQTMKSSLKGLCRWINCCNLAHTSHASHNSNDFMPNLTRSEGICTIHNNCSFHIIKDSSTDPILWVIHTPKLGS